MTDAPERIWVMVTGGYALEDGRWTSVQFGAGDPEYVRADLYDGASLLKHDVDMWRESSDLWAKRCRSADDRIATLEQDVADHKEMRKRGSAENTGLKADAARLREAIREHVEACDHLLRMTTTGDLQAKGAALQRYNTSIERLRALADKGEK
jgi:chromosome segregation ATPase